MIDIYVLLAFVGLLIPGVGLFLYVAWKRRQRWRVLKELARRNGLRATNQGAPPELLECARLLPAASSRLAVRDVLVATDVRGRFMVARCGRWRRRHLVMAFANDAASWLGGFSIATTRHPDGPVTAHVSWNAAVTQLLHDRARTFVGRILHQVAASAETALEGSVSIAVEGRLVLIHASYNEGLDQLEQFIKDAKELRKRLLKAASNIDEVRSAEHRAATDMTPSQAARVVEEPDQISEQLVELGAEVLLQDKPPEPPKGWKRESGKLTFDIPEPEEKVTVISNSRGV